MKKWLSVFLSAVLLLTFVTTAFAAQTEEYQNLLLIVKQRLNITDEYDDFSGGTSNDDGNIVYRFEWTVKDSKYLSVTITSDGVITDYICRNLNESYDDKTAFKKYELESYKAEAEKYIAVLNPDLADNIVVSENNRYSLWSQNAMFTLDYVADGIKCADIYGSVSINSDDLSLKSFHLYNYVKVSYPNKKDFISKDAAIDAYAQNYGAELIYTLEYDENGVTAVPVYVPVSADNEYINAATGEKYVRNYSNIKYAGSAASESAANDSAFSQIEQNEINNIGGLLQIDTLFNQLKSNKALAFSENAKLSSYDLNKISNDKYYYDISVNDGDEIYCYIAVNAKNGEILNFRRYSDSYSATELSADEASKKAEKYAKILAGGKYAEYTVNDNNSENGISFTRVVNGIKVDGDNIRAAVNKYDGTLSQYSINYSEIDFPSIDGVITKDAALNAMFDSVPYSVQYVYDTNEDNLQSAVGVYCFDDLQIKINPFTAELIKNNSEFEKYEYSDIDGHYANKQISKLSQYNIGLPGEKFMPDEKITQKDMITLLTQAFGGYSVSTDTEYDSIFDNAVRLGLIDKDERNDDGTVSRIDATVYIARAIGADEYARLEGIWNCKFADVTEKTGYVCLLNGLGIINGDENNNFNPYFDLTRADCAILVYNCLSK